MRRKPEIPEEIEEYRDECWRREETRRIECAFDAERFIEHVGFAACLTDSRQPGPSLYVAVTAWLYVDEHGVESVQVNPNITIAQLTRQFGPPDTPDAEVGIHHSEAQAAEWFRMRPRLRVLQIFSERIPCAMMCGPMLQNYFPGVPWYYYYNRRSWFDGSRGGLVKTAAAALKTAYSL